MITGARENSVGGRYLRVLGLATVLGLLGGCVEPNPGYQRGPTALEDCRQGEEVQETFESFERPGELDILVIMDNSGSVDRTQRAFARALPDFLDTLSARDIATRLGVVNTDAVSADGLAPPGVQGSECRSNSAAWADSRDGGDWTRVAACNVVQGDRGDARQQAFSVARTSLLTRPGNLADFFRPRARKLMLIVSNEDDCSGDSLGGGGRGESVRQRCAQNASRLDTVARWVEELREESASEEGLMLAVISGPPGAEATEDGRAGRASCQSTLGAAYPAPRLWEATRLFGPQGLFESICVEDLNFSLARIADTLARPARLTLCPDKYMVHEPLGVDVFHESGDSERTSAGEAGFIFLGETASCENGAISLNPGVLEGAERVEMRYCTD